MRRQRNIVLLCLLSGLLAAGAAYCWLSGSKGAAPVAVLAPSQVPETTVAVPGNDSCLQLLRNGDLLLRTGNDEISNVFRHLNTHDQTYSHAGIVLIESGRPYVYHSIGGADNPQGHLRRDEVSAFISPKHNLGWAIVRLDLDSNAKLRLAERVDSLYHQSIGFDDNFDLRTDDKLYCTEFVYKCVIHASGDSAYLPVTTRQQARYIAVDNLFNNKHAQTICQLRYK